MIATSCLLYLLIKKYTFNLKLNDGTIDEETTSSGNNQDEMHRNKIKSLYFMKSLNFKILYIAIYIMNCSFK
jgi:hypothetical protein